MIRPPKLLPGDVIAIAATARKMSEAEVAVAVRLFESWGLKVKLSSTLFREQNQFAGSDEDRAKGLQELLDDDSVKAIINARGGYGTVRIIDQLNFKGLIENSKWIVGFSDVTVLHSHIHMHFGIETLHAPMVLNLLPEREDAMSTVALKNALMSDDSIRIEAPAHTMNKPGNAKGVLVGGNLSVLYSLIGSASDLNTDGKILFLEDLDEYLYHIDRMMVNMKRTGKLNKLAGLVIGDMSDMRDNAIPFGSTAEEIILNHVSGFDYPVCFGFPAGHEKRNQALRFGAEASLDVSDKGSVLIF